jgi:hypothetical protein
VRTLNLGLPGENGVVIPWTPKPRGRIDWSSLDLTPVEAFVLSRIDGATDMGQLAQVSGLASDELGRVLERLAEEGVIEGPPSTPAQAVRAADAAGPAPAPDAAHAMHRELFERTLHALPPDARVGLAETATEPQLSALCFDPVPEVVSRVLDNPHGGLVHARLIAAWHPNPVGLEALGRRGDLVRDGEVQRLLLRNNQTPTHLVRQLLIHRRLHDVYNVAQSHEAAERHRSTAREVLRTRFATASPEERVELILITEGRALATLSGLSLDGKAAALLCARTLSSTLLLENLARWPATPPNLVAHLLQQPLVRRMPSLQAALKRHPNCPGHAK